MTSYHNSFSTRIYIIINGVMQGGKFMMNKLSLIRQIRIVFTVLIGIEKGGFTFYLQLQS